jgi:hypothetical protein
MHYAYFSIPHRLAVKTGSSVWVYDTLDHQIGGFSQQQGSSGGITFSSQFGTVDLNSLPVVMRDGQPVMDTPAVYAQRTPEPVTSVTVESSPGPQSATNEFDVISMLERLGDLRAKGILTDAEFDDKKKQLLARL